MAEPPAGRTVARPWNPSFHDILSRGLLLSSARAVAPGVPGLATAHRGALFSPYRRRGSGPERLQSLMAALTTKGDRRTTGMDTLGKWGESFLIVITGLSSLSSCPGCG